MLLHALAKFLVICFVVAVVIAIIVFLIRKAPVIPGEYKEYLEWLAIAIGLILIIIAALAMLGVAV